ncbi:uncharacterized protein PV07_08846 [Cladophialophora immunda]|uniref:Xylanolytic transcriptional activator regulatory domain-containing protein n=1 Tax=Cladophialophora immunda TaxID=569365 RepID=A0A0D2C5D2_9EURO|nr:uncharacterized protein PV07_08846 [Cladophialophora immunda]KIW25685.1 hypothetical protein PV07_08846 [Cladophialophora immunda]
MVQCDYYRPARNQGGAGPAAPSNRELLPGIGDAVDVRGGEWRQMTTQIQAVMEKVDLLNEKINAISSPSSTHAVQHMVESDPGILTPRGVDARPVNTAQSAEPDERETSMPLLDAAGDSATIYPEYHGPTSSEFTFEVADESLTKLGVGCAFSNSHRLTKAPSSPHPPYSVPGEKMLFPRLLGRDPLWTMERSDALKYFDTYHRTIGAMYPVTSRLRLASKAQVLLDSLDVARGRLHLSGSSGRLIELMLSVDTQILKIQLAIGMMTELGAGGTHRATELMQTVLDASDDSLMNVEGLGGVQILVLTALFYYNLDDELRASRYSCLASRRCLEMGLHRRETLLKHFPGEDARKEVLRIFWSVYTLDRRTSLGLGVPFVIQDSLVDSALVSIDFEHDYLRAMIPFAKLSAKAWHMNNEFPGKEPHVVHEDIDYLDYQVRQWQKQIPASIRYVHGQSAIPDAGASSDADELQRFYLGVALCVRSNQLRNVIYRPLLQSASRIDSDLEHTRTALKIAKDSLQTLSDLDATTSLLYTHATFFKHFIVSSLGNLLLIVVHAPAAEYWAEIRDTLRAASMLLRKLSHRSGPVSRAWDRLKGLEDVQAKILAARRAKPGAQQQEQQQQQQQLAPQQQPNQQGQQGQQEPNQKDVSCLASMRLTPAEGICGLSDSWNVGVGGSGSGTEDYMLFDSQIRDEFAGVFDPALRLDDLYDFPFLEDGR